jgi:hypothetical protein
VSMATIRISETDAARDFHSLMARVRAGVEVVAARPGRLLSESIALAEAHAKELGYEPVMDADFAPDMEEIVRKRRPRDTSAWD